MLCWAAGADFPQYCAILMLISSIDWCSVALLMLIFRSTVLFWCWFQALLDALLRCWCKYRPTRFFGASLKMGAVRQKQKHLFGRVVAFSIIHFFGGAGCIYHFWDGLHYSFCTMNDALSILPCCQCSIAIGETIRLVEFTCKGFWLKSLFSLPTKPKYKLSLNALCIQGDGPNRHLC